MKKLLYVLIVTLFVSSCGNSKKDKVACMGHLKQIGTTFIMNNDPTVLENNKCPITDKPYQLHKDWETNEAFPGILTCYEHATDSAGRQVGHTLYKNGAVK